MAGLREWVRTRIPLSQEAYERLVHTRRRRRSRVTVRELARRPEPLKLDIGGGSRQGANGWVVVDITHECDLYWDLREGIPFADGTIEAVYSSHFLEHLTFEDGQAVLAECLRVLRPGGSISIAVPDARMYIESYVQGRRLPDAYFGWRPAYNGTTAIDVVNYVAYMDGEHRYLFDQENLVHRLRAAGFADARAREFDPELDMAERDFETIYAVGHKPG